MLGVNVNVIFKFMCVGIERNNGKKETIKKKKNTLKGSKRG